MNRARGFALAELVVALVIAGIIGVALTRLVLNQARFVSMQDAMMRSRSGARAALNVLSEELRMVSGGGVVAATQDSITLRVPYAFGVSCKSIAGHFLGLFPADSAIYAGATPSGYAYRNAAGRYVFVGNAVANITPGVLYFLGCTLTSPSITLPTAVGWSIPTAVQVSLNAAMDTATAVYLYQEIRYAFAPSTQIPGRIALWRTVLSTGVREELVAPFDTAAGFSFLVGSRYTPQAAPPSPLDSLRGVRVRLVAASETAPQGRTSPTNFDLSVNVYFRNYAP